MPQINILSPHVADLIAAGEVVERPASVIKELLENAFDAGAKNVTVEIRDGGATMIRITDDGCGMAPEDAGIAFLRHATSKLQDEHGLEAIETMGFRGEALAAISAVSRIELTTRRAEDSEGTYMTLTAGDIDEMEPIGCPAGTVICVRDLFYNTPARQKFLKSDRSEASACIQTGLRCALGRPEISVRFLRDGREEFFTPGDGELSSAVYALLGREIASTLLPLQSSDEGLQVSGFVSSPAAGRGNRSAQYFFVNGRFIRSALLQAALEQAYKNTLLTGRYPACVILLAIRPGAVDVNVHPAKTEVKFSEEKRVFNLLYQAVQETLHEEDRTAAAGDTVKQRTDKAPEAETAFASGAESDRMKNAEASSVPAASPASVESEISEPQQLRNPKTLPTAYETPTVPAWKATAEPEQSLFRQTEASRVLAGQPEEAITREAAESTMQQMQPGTGRAENRIAASEAELAGQTGPRAGLPGSAGSAAATPAWGTWESLRQQDLLTVEKPAQDVGMSEIPNHKIVGEALKTYIIVELEDRLLLIDKHAAHERMNFDRLKARQQPIPVQQLMIPQTMRLSTEERELLEEFRELFEDFGFEIEDFGEREVILRGVPADLRPEDAVPALEEILEHLRKGSMPDPLSARDELLHTVACKAAIKAGWDTGVQELERIAEEVLSGRVRYCPHGRPVSVTVTRKDLDKLFLRIV